MNLLLRSLSLFSIAALLGMGGFGVVNAQAPSAPTEPGLGAYASEATNTFALQDAPAEEDQRLLQSAISGAGSPCRVKVYGHLQLGFTFNPDDPGDHQNFGRLFDDRSNQLLMNQLLLTVEQTLDPKPNELDWGFKLQLMYGSDARFIHYLGILDNTTDDTIQPDLVEAQVNIHFPILTDGGVDLKLGMFTTLAGAEYIDPEANYLYSHTYMFNFGIPFKHTGALVCWHMCEAFDLHAGLVNGINTGIDDNNDAVSFHGGFNLKLFDGDVNLFTTVHVGPENDEAFDDVFGTDANDDPRTIVDVVLTIKPAEGWTLMTDVNFGHDQGNLGIDAVEPEWYGIAQYLIYDFSEMFQGVLRFEWFRDDDGFAVVQFAEHDDFIDIQRGRLGGLDPRTVGGGGTSYFALTAGLNVRPCDFVRLGLEVRYDWSESSTDNDPFDDSSDDDAFSVGINAMILF